MSVISLEDRVCMATDYLEEVSLLADEIMDNYFDDPKCQTDPVVMAHCFNMHRIKTRILSSCLNSAIKVLEGDIA